MIADITEGMQLYGTYLIADAKKCLSNAGKPYWSLVLQDASGCIDAKKWDVEPDDEAILEKGKAAYIIGNVLLYGTKLQVKITSVEAVDPKKIDWSSLIPSAPVAPNVLEEKLHLYLLSIRDQDIARIVNDLIAHYKDRYLSHPAAVRNHHGFLHGLLYHSLTMCDLAIKVANLYPVLNRDMMIAGSLIHDIGKVYELSGPVGTFYTLQGRLLGHIAIGQAEIREAAKRLGYYEFLDLSEDEQKEQESQNSPVFHRYEIAVQLEHIILSHHGHYEFGSPVLPLTREAVVISLIDDLDAKLLGLDNAFAGVAPGEVTGRVMSMDNRYFYNPHSSPAEHAPYGTSVEEESEDLKK